MTIVKFTRQKNSAINSLNLEKKINFKNIIFFSKFELNSILTLYSKQVSKGLWRDYALDSQHETATFSVYRHTHDKPIYKIIKKRQKGKKNKAEFLIFKDMKVINKSDELAILLLKLEKKLKIRSCQNY